MLNIFRKFRRGLLSGNKITRYLLYAIGEIILVVIGILIALAINNRNEARILREKEQIYLAGLQEEFIVSQHKLATLLQVNHENFNNALKLLRLRDHPVTAEESEVSQLLFNTFAQDLAFNPNNSLLLEMINTGSLKDLSDTELRRLLTNWMATLEDIAKQERDLEEQREHVLALFRRGDYHLRSILDETGVSRNLGLPPGRDLPTDESLLASPAFENNLLMFLLTSHATEQNHYLPLQQDLTEILDRIEVALAEHGD